MRVVAAQIVEDDRHDRGLEVQPQPKIACAMGCAPGLQRDVAVITHSHPSEVGHTHGTSQSPLM